MQPAQSVRVEAHCVSRKSWYWVFSAVKVLERKKNGDVLQAPDVGELRKEAGSEKVVGRKVQESHGGVILPEVLDLSSTDTENEKQKL